MSLFTPRQQPDGLAPPTGPPPGHPPKRKAQTKAKAPARAGSGMGVELRIGRAPDNDIVIEDLEVSPRHAIFVSLPDGSQVVRDLRSSTGTFLNGTRLPAEGIERMRDGDALGIGRVTLVARNGRLEEQEAGEARLVARGLTVLVDDDRPILRDVSFEASARSLVAVVGPSGSGKSTLLKALTGYRPADHGEVSYADRDLYRNFGELRSRVGLVPQDDILHTELSVRRALGYAAELRFPGHVGAPERQQRIQEVLRELRLDVHQDKRVSELSGGQRKRVSVALELLTRPSLMLLDEPTSGLDPGMDRDVMQLLRRLADDGRTVLVATHSVAQLDLADQVLVMAPTGTLAYAGPPGEALAFFGRESWADVFMDFEDDREADWDARWRRSRRSRDRARADRRPRVIHRHRTTPLAPQPWRTQFSTLVRRYVAVIGADRGFLGLLLVLPMVLGAATLVIRPGKDLTTLGYDRSGMLIPNIDATTVVMVLASGICFTGAANAVRELVKERVIYERERAVGLSRSAYLWSKVLVLGVITALQGLAMALIALPIRGLPGRGVVLGPAVVLELALPLMLLGVVAMTVGLAISAVVATSERTMPMLVMFAVLQIVFGGCLFPLLGSPANYVSYVMPARWGVGAMGTTLDLNQLFRDRDHPDRLDPLWSHSAGWWVLAMLMMIVLGALCLVAVSRFLRRHEPEVMR